MVVLGGVKYLVSKYYGLNVTQYSLVDRGALTLRRLMSYI